MNLAIVQYFYRKVIAPQCFRGGDGLRHDNFTNLDRHNKLSTKWEGHYNIIKIVAPDSYYAEDREGIKLPQLFNV